MSWQDYLDQFPDQAQLASESLATGPHSARHGQITDALNDLIRDLNAARTATGDWDSFYNMLAGTVSPNVINPASPEFGATFDDSTDDTAALNAALYALAASGGGFLVLPDGIARHATTLNVPSNVFIVGAGPGTTGLRFTGGPLSYQVQFKGTYGDGSGHVRNAGLRGVRLFPGEYNVGINVEHASSLHLADFRVDNAAYGLRVYGGWDSVVTGDWRIQECANGIFIASHEADGGVGGAVDSNNWRFYGGTIESGFGRDIEITAKGVDGSGTGGQKPNHIWFHGLKIESRYVQDKTRLVIDGGHSIRFSDPVIAYDGWDDGYDEPVDAVEITGSSYDVQFVGASFQNSLAPNPIDNWFVFNGTDLCSLTQPLFSQVNEQDGAHVRFVGTNRKADWPADGAMSDPSWTPGALVVDGSATSARATFVRADGLVAMTDGLVLEDGYEAASRAYVDNVAAGLKWRQPVRSTSKVDVDVSELNAGDSVGGVTVANGDRVALVGQATGSQNGIYLVGTNKPGGADPKTARADDMDAGAEFPGASFVTLEGTHAGEAFVCTNASAPTVGSTTITFRQFSSGAVAPDGTSITQTGTTISRAALSGDVTAAAGSNTTTVAKLAGQTLSATVPTAQQVLTFDGAAWGPASAPSFQVAGLVASSAETYAAANTTKIQAALDAAETAGGGVVQLPPSSSSAPFFVNATLKVGAGVTLRGAGWKATWLKQATGANLDAVVATKGWYNSTAAVSEIGATIEFLAVDYFWRNPVSTSLSSISATAIGAATTTGTSGSGTAITVASNSTRQTGDTVRFTALTNVTGVSVDTTYYVIRSSNTQFSVAPSYREALAGTGAITITCTATWSATMQFGWQKNRPAGTNGTVDTRWDGATPHLAHGHGIAVGGAFACTIRRCHVQNAYMHGIWADATGRDRSTAMGRGNQLRIEDCFVQNVGSNGIVVNDVDMSDGFMLRNVITAPNGQDWSNTTNNANLGHGMVSIGNGWTFQGNHVWVEWAENSGWNAWGNGKVKHAFRLNAIGGGRIYGNKAANYGYSNYAPGTSHNGAYCGFHLICGDDRATDFFGNDVSGAEPHSGESGYQYIAYRLYSGSGLKSTIACSGNTVKMRDPDNGPNPGIPGTAVVWGFDGTSTGELNVTISGTQTYNVGEYAYYTGTPTLKVRFEPDAPWLSTTSSATMAASNAQLINAQIWNIVGFDPSAAPTTVASGSNSVDTATFTGTQTLNVASTTNRFPPSGTACIARGSSKIEVTYTGVTSTTLTGVTRTTGTGTLATGDKVYPLPAKGGRVTLPASTKDAPFEIDAAVIVPNGIEIVGQGMHRTHLRQRSGTNLDAMIAGYYWWHNTYRGTAAKGQEGCRVADLTLDGNSRDWDNITTLNAAVADSSTTTINFSSRQAVSGKTVVVDSEFITVPTTASTGAGTIASCTRGAYGSTAAAHSSGAKVGIIRNVSTTNARTTSVVGDGHGVAFGSPHTTRIESVEVLRPYGCGVFFDNLGRDRSTNVGFAIQWFVNRLWVSYPGACGFHNAGAVNDGHVFDWYIQNVNQLDLNTATSGGDYANQYYGHYVYDSDGGGSRYIGGHGYGDYSISGNTAFPGSRCKNGVWIRNAASRISGILVADFGQGSNDGAAITCYGMNILGYYKRGTTISGCKVHADFDVAANTKYLYRFGTQHGAGTSVDFSISNLEGGPRTDSGRATAPTSAATSTLNTTVDATTTTIVLASGHGLAAGDVILIGDEAIRLGTLSTNTFSSCVRGWSNTVPAAHTAGDSLWKVLFHGMIMSRTTSGSFNTGSVTGCSFKAVAIPFDGAGSDQSSRVKLTGNSWQYAGTVPPTAGSSSKHGYVPLGYAVDNDCSSVTNVARWVCTSAGTTDAATFTALALP